MSTKKIVHACAFLAGLFLAQPLMAANETEVVLEKTITSVTPFFLSGHEGDINAIAGFDFTVNTFFHGNLIGTASGRATLLDPPLRPTDAYNHSFIRIVNDLPGIGTFEVNGSALALTSSTSASAGDVVFAWSGSISNGTGNLTNIFGLSSGTAIVNQSTGTGSLKEVIRFRFGF